MPNNDQQFLQSYLDFLGGQQGGFISPEINQFIQSMQAAQQQGQGGGPSASYQGAAGGGGGGVGGMAQQVAMKYLENKMGGQQMAPQQGPTTQMGSMPTEQFSGPTSISTSPTGSFQGPTQMPHGYGHAMGSSEFVPSNVSFQASPDFSSVPSGSGSSFSGGVGTPGEGIGTSFGTQAPEIAGEGTSTLGSTLSDVSDTIGSGVKAVGSSLSDLASGVGNVASSAGSALGSAASGAGSAIGSAAASAGSAVGSAAAAAGSAAGSAATAIVSAIASLFSDEDLKKNKRVVKKELRDFLDALGGS